MAVSLPRSASAITTYQRCPAEYDMRYNARRVSVDRSPFLDVGKGVHRGLEYIKDGRPDYIDAVRQELQYVYFTQALFAELMTIAWKEKYAQDGWQWIQNELQFDVELDGVPVHGVIDGLVLLPTGEVALVEHKTTRVDISPNAGYWNRLAINTQIDLYNLVCAELSYDVDCIIYDVIRIPQLRMRKKTKNIEYYKRSGSYKGRDYKKGSPKPGQQLADETRDEFKVRAAQYVVDNVDSLLVRSEPIVRTKIEREKTLNDVKTIDSMINCGFFPRSNNCFRGQFECDYLPVCRGESGLDNDQLYRIRSHRD